MNGGGGGGVGGGGEEVEGAEFVEAYQGPNTCHVVRHLEPTVTYTFRVCGRAEGASIWSPWSVTQEGSTGMLHYGKQSISQWMDGRREGGRNEWSSEGSKDERIGLLGYISPLYGRTGQGTTWANEEYFWYETSPDAGLIT